MNNSNNASNEHNKDNNFQHAKKLFQLLKEKPISRRMAATFLGYTDQTYMVTQLISDWIRDGKAQVVGEIRCTRSGRNVEAISTNPDLFISKNDDQLTLF